MTTLSQDHKRRSPGEVRRRLLHVLRDKSEFLKSATRSFRQFDRNQTELLEYDDVLQLVNRLCKNLTLPPIDEQTLRHIFSKYDTEQAGYLTLQEFLQFYWRLLWRVQEKYYPDGEAEVRRELFVGRYSLNEEEIYEIFEFTKMVGHGSFGEVYLVRDRQVGEAAGSKICKIINKVTATIPLDQIEAEITVLKTLDHPNIIKIFDVYEDAQFIYIIMEYCQGGELLHQIVQLAQQNKVMSEDYTAYIMFQIFKALAYFHNEHVCHKDLKPENILFNDPHNPTVKVIDFGLAEIFQPARKHLAACPTAADGVEAKCSCGGGESVYSHNAAGTVLYMAPEVFQRRVHLKCDIWSAGCLMYLMLTGHLPYSGKTVGEIRAKVMANLPPRGFMPGGYGSGTELTSDCLDLMRCCLEKNVKRRPSAREVLEHPWFRKRAFTQLGHMPTRYMKNFKRISRLNDVKLCILNLVAHQLDLTNALVQEISRLFILLDTNHDGWLDAAELGAALIDAEAVTRMEDACVASEDSEQHEAGGLAPWEFNRFFQILDLDQDGLVSFNEFLAAAYSWTQAEMSLVWVAFTKLDKSCAGRIAVDEMVAALSARGAQRPSALRRAVKELDRNSDGFIDWPEFVAYLRRRPAETQRRP